MKNLEITARLALALILLIPAFGVQAFAVTSVFDVDVKDADPTHNYKICLTDKGVPPEPEWCLEWKGTEFAAMIASFEVEDIGIGYEQTVLVEDLTSHTIVEKDHTNTKTNPDIITISMKDAKSGTIPTYDVETEYETDEEEGTSSPDTDQAEEDPATVTASRGGMTWIQICQQLDPILIPSCSSLVYPDNTLTGEGERARVCIQNGIALAGGATLLALPLPLVIGALKLLSEPTGCGDIIEWDYADSVGGLKEIIGIFS